MCMVAVEGLRLKSLGDLIHGDDPITEVPEDLDPGLVGERAKDDRRVPLPVVASTWSSCAGSASRCQRVHLSAIPSYAY